MRKPIGFQINLEEGSKIKTLKMSDELSAYFDKEYATKTATDYITEFLGSQKAFDKANEIFTQAMSDSLPKGLGSDCLYCKGESKDEDDKKCTKYYLQMNLSFSVSATEYVNIVLKNQHIKNNKKFLKELTINFFRCFNFIKDHGLVYFDLEQLVRHCLNAGFLSISEIFSKSDVLYNLSSINNSIDKLEEEDLNNKLYNKEDVNYLELQKKFFENKLRFYKEELQLQKELKLANHTPKNNKKENTTKPTVPQYALYYYYLQEGRDYPYFENHPEGKVKAINELIEKEGLQTTAKHFQIKYNFIANYRTNRIAKNQKKNIDYVANTMLNNYKNSREIAISELSEIINRYK